MPINTADPKLVPKRKFSQYSVRAINKTWDADLLTKGTRKTTISTISATFFRSMHYRSDTDQPKESWYYHNPIIGTPVLLF